MPHDHPPAVELATYDAPVARAVAAVLHRAGLPATTVGAEQAGGETAVFVPHGRREEALTVIAARMEEISARAGAAAAASAGAARPGDGDAAASWQEDGGDRPLVLERFRSLGFVAVALVPILVVTLANVRLPLAYALAVVVGGMVLLTAWRNGRLGGRDR